MSQDNFEQICDQLSQVVDPNLFERLRWDRTEGPMLAGLVVLVHAALQERSEFELSEEGSTRAMKRFVLKVHSNRVVAISIWLKGGRVKVAATQIDRSPYKLVDAQPHIADFDTVDQQWMANALQDLFSRIRVSKLSPPPKPAPAPRQIAPKEQRRLVQ